ncbi:MAG: peroxiredoxin family protein [Pyrinomonadaceae bacterium]
MSNSQAQRNSLIPNALATSATAQASNQSNNFKLDVSGMNLPKDSKVLVLALSPTCGYCTQSAPFYRELVKKAKSKNVKIIAIFGQQEESGREYLDSLQLNEIEVKPSSITNYPVQGTPSAILFGSNGEIVGEWLGKLRTESENDLANSIS